MSYYRTCPNCGAALDPGERCDCREGTEGEARENREAAASTTNTDGGRVERDLRDHFSASSLTETKEDCKHE